MTQTYSTKRGWLTLQNASKQLGVSPATLRQWADKGQIRTFRTPGGHRRFSETDMRALISDRGAPSPTRNLERLIHSALGRTRLEIAGGRLDREPWYLKFDAAAKERHRALGHRLMTLLLATLQQEKQSPNLIRRARRLGQEYGRVSLQAKTPLPDALRAFLFFRDYVFEDLIELSSGQEVIANPSFIDAYRRLSRLVNEMLVAMVETYSEGKSR